MLRVRCARCNQGALIVERGEGRHDVRSIRGVVSQEVGRARRLVRQPWGSEHLDGGVVKKHRRHFVQRRAVGDRADEPMDERRGEDACGGVGQGLIVRHFGAVRVERWMKRKGDKESYENSQMNFFPSFFPFFQSSSPLE